MALFAKLIRGTYRDSVFLMQIANKIEKLEGISRVAILNTTEQNKALLREVGLFAHEIGDGSPNDIAVAVRASSSSIAKEAVSKAEELLSSPRIAIAEKSRTTRTLEMALKLLPEANLALISIPGAFVKREAMNALKRGLDLMIFSNNVSIVDEVKIKQFANEKNRLVMGPDCGTAIMRGVALGFGNRVRNGPIGVVGASGTGIQEVTSLIHRHGSGISQAIGTGSNDVTKEVGAITMMKALRMQESDPETKVVVVVSKPFPYEIQRKILRFLKKCRKPAFINFVGSRDLHVSGEHVIQCRTLEETALRAVSTISGEGFDLASFSTIHPKMFKIAEKEASQLAVGQKFVRGLFTGGTLGSEACLIIKTMLGDVHTNMNVEYATRLSDPNQSIRHTIVDLGAEEFTLGKPHPILNPLVEKERIVLEAKDPETAVLLLDIILGYSAHPDPASIIIPILQKAKGLAALDGRYLPIVVSVCGTDQDPQDHSRQQRKLEKAGVIVMPSNAKATEMAALIARRGKVSSVLGTDYAIKRVFPRAKHGRKASNLLGRGQVMEPSSTQAKIRVINIGIIDFFRSLKEQNAEAIHVDWTPPIVYDKKLLSLLDELT